MSTILHPFSKGLSYVSKLSPFKDSLLQICNTDALGSLNVSMHIFQIHLCETIYNLVMLIILLCMLMTKTILSIHVYIYVNFSTLLLPDNLRDFTKLWQIQNMANGCKVLKNKNYGQSFHCIKTQTSMC